MWRPQGQLGWLFPVMMAVYYFGGPAVAMAQVAPTEPFKAAAIETAPTRAEPVKWGLDRTVAAPEAVQAAAADAQFLYAISSTQVARYDRETGQRLAVSSGQAQHLNSGFLSEGRLYCAHSNYPQVPERSEIKVLDLASLQLTTFHDFGDSKFGSLTWAVQRSAAAEHGGWWCTFARYGADNAQTVLVQFDESWQPRGTWTYPPSVVRELGKYSISGGIWHGDELLVTGHDKREIYVLGLPQTGTQLEHRRTCAVPFTGQGFAVDGDTGRLVGIDRARRQIVLAVPIPPADVQP